MIIYRSNCGHAAGDTQAGCDGGQDGYRRLKNKLPSTLFHVFVCLMINIMFVDCGVLNVECGVWSVE